MESPSVASAIVTSSDRRSGFSTHQSITMATTIVPNTAPANEGKKLNPRLVSEYSIRPPSI